MHRQYPIDVAAATALAASRRHARVTQNQVALELGMSEARISKIETARVGVDPDTRAAIERAIARLAGRRLSA